MFGFLRKVKQRWEQRVQETRAPVVEELSNLLLHVTHQLALAHGFKEGDSNTQALMERQGQIVLGFEAFRAGCNPRELSDSKPLIKAAAARAQVACNDAILKGKIDQQQVASDLRMLLGFS